MASSLSPTFLLPVGVIFFPLGFPSLCSSTMATSEDGRRPFPEDLYGNILLRLPVKSLLRFKCVCKNWYTLIKNPNFIKEHLNNCSNNKSLQLLIYDYSAPDGSPPITLISDHGLVPLHDNSNYFQRFRGMTDLVGAVDGLFLLKKVSDDKISLLALWNPATREVRVLPEPETPFSTSYDHFGFGLDPSTNDYKVVYLNFCFEGDAAVYSCSRDSWRIFTPKIYEFFKVIIEACGTAYLNGTYYWLIRAGIKCIILSFDFSNEVFEEIDGPDDDSYMVPLLLDDFVALLTFKEYSLHDIWVMIQPGVWNKLFTFQCFPYVKSWDSSTAILVTRSSRLVSHNVRTQKTTHLEFRQPGLIRDAYEDGYGVYPYKESLVTIKWESGDLNHCNYPDLF